MSILLLSALLWVLVSTAVAAVLASSRTVWGGDRRRGLQWASLAFIAALLLFRPHEDILGGQDPGVYVNNAHAFARQDSLFFTDPMLRS